jgi:urease accessory protein
MMMDALFAPPKTPQESARWAAELDVHLALREGKTKIAHLAHCGPLRIQRPFYPEADGTAHVYVLHPPGGIAGGDLLNINVESGEGTRSLFTTPSATKLYRSLGPRAHLTQRLIAHKHAVLEWLPQETIAFGGAQAELKTLVQLEEHAAFLGWDILCLGRPAAGDDFHTGRVSTRLEIHRGATPLFVDRLLVGEDHPTRSAAWGLRGHCAVGTMLMTAPDKNMLGLVRHALQLSLMPVDQTACTTLGELIVVRYVGSSVPECWALFTRIWEVVRPVLTGRAAVAPRIWSC